MDSEMPYFLIWSWTLHKAKWLCMTIGHSHIYSCLDTCIASELLITLHYVKIFFYMKISDLFHCLVKIMQCVKDFHNVCNLKICNNIIRHVNILKLYLFVLPGAHEGPEGASNNGIVVVEPGC